MTGLLQFQDTEAARTEWTEKTMDDFNKTGDSMAQSNEHNPKLSKSTGDAVDRLLEHGLDSTSSPDGNQDTDSVRSLLGLLDHYPVEDASDELVDATLARINRHEAEEESRLRLNSADSPIPMSRWRFPDLVATAAALFLAVGIGWPVWKSVQNQKAVGQSQARLNGIGAAIAGFAGENNGMMPLDQLALNSPFDPIQTPHSSHLTLLSDQEYLDSSHLHLDDQAKQGTSFAYRVPFQVRTFVLQRLTLKDGLASDRNPVIWCLRHKKGDGNSLGGSPTHDGRGQVILTGDLSTRWTYVPMLNGDPIWTSNRCLELENPVCQPHSEADTVLAD
ncbi:MAG: hypothetical protein MK085_08150 [Phycisphaerales bacterium]|nr:hypothetical protein [Phycisphaerales bacterium]